MKKFISIMMTLILVLTSVVSISSPMSASAKQGYVEKLNANYTQWSAPEGVGVKKTFACPTSPSNTMTFVSAGGLDSNPKGYPQPVTSVELVNKKDLSATYPKVCEDNSTTDKLVKFTQNANIGMFRMKGAYPALSSTTTIRVTFKMFITDICTKAISFDKDGTTVLDPVKDTKGTVKEIPMSLIPQKASANCGVQKDIKIPVNQWYTVTEELQADVGANGVRLSIGTVADEPSYNCNFPGTIFYDGNFRIDVFEEIVAPKEGDYTMIARFNPGDSEMDSPSKGSGTAMFSDNTVGHSASIDHTSEPAKQSDANGKFITAASTLDTKINPSTLSSIDYPGIADTKVSSSGLIARLNRTAACSVIRFTDIIDKGSFNTGDRFKMKAWIYIADTYSRGEYDSLNKTSKVTDKSAQKDPDAKTAKVRYIYCPDSKSTNADGIMKTYELETYKWHQIEIEGTVNNVLDAVDIKIDQTSDCYGDPYAGTWFLGNIEIYHADKIPERNANTNWKTISNVDFESEKTAISDIAYSVESSLDSSIQTIDSLVNEYPQSEIGTAGLNVYKFSMNNSATSRFKINTIFDSTKIEPGDVVRISASIFPADHTNTNAKTAKVRMFLADKETSPIADDKCTSVNLKLDAWSKVAFTYTATADDISATQGVMIDAAGETDFANTLIISDIKTEVYKSGDAIPENLSYTEDFEGYSYATQTHINTPHYRTFGSNGGTLTIGTTNATLTGMVPASGTNALGITNRGGNNTGIKINDIFQGYPISSDIGKTFRVSLKVYADKSYPLYKKSAESADKNLTALTDAEKESAKETAFTLSYGGPDDKHYKYRTASENIANTVVPFNTWTTMSGDITITKSMIDNGDTSDNASNPLVSSIRIDQTGASGETAQPICNTFYIDDLTVTEVLPAKFTMPKVFSSNMVFQRNMPFKIWGFATEDKKKITATIGTQTKTTTSKDGRWEITFDPMDTARDLTLKVSSPEEEDIVFTNIAIGEVILTAGQSNMNAKFSSPVKAGYEDALAIMNDTSVLKDIRVLKMPTKGHLDPQDDVNVKWTVVSESNITSRSAVGYVTAYYIAKEQNIPVGFIEACTGGLTVEAFMDLETLKSREMYKDYYIAFYERQHASGIDPDTWKFYPTGVYNTMLHPLKGMTIGSCVWYQGGSNRPMAENGYSPAINYEYLLYDFIHMIRSYHNNKNMPFVVCEQANLPYDTVRDVRQAQLNTILRMGNDKVYFVSTSDVGATNYDVEIENMLHPSNKVPVGKRSAFCIMADKFGYEGEYSGPIYENITVEGNKAILTFSHADGLKQVAKIEGETEITGFEISSDKETFVKANATLGENNTVIVSAETVSNPTTVRYCYNTFTYYDKDGNLLSGNGISESKFRTEYMPEGCKTIGHLGGNLYNGADLPLAPFIATVIKPEVTSCSIEPKETEIHYTATLSNTDFSTGDKLVIAALFTEGQLKYMKIFDTKSVTEDTMTINSSFDASTVNPNSELKFFLWDGFDNLKPFESAKTLTFK
ncbi:MAG: hypothetical protein E7396_03845 [Ruminococcaceae bacterium]|nr:hypothetical protein [Oscillospiraceae bacterium]